MTPPWKTKVVDIRFGLLKKLARVFFRDLGAPIEDADLLRMVLEFLLVIRDGNQNPVAEVRDVMRKHPQLINLIDQLRREGVVTYDSVPFFTADKTTTQHK